MGLVLHCRAWLPALSTSDAFRIRPIKRTGRKTRESLRIEEDFLAGLRNPFLFLSPTAPAFGPVDWRSGVQPAEESLKMKQRAFAREIGAVARGVKGSAGFAL